jgi:hypothetical protein
MVVVIRVLEHTQLSAGRSAASPSRGGRAAMGICIETNGRRWHFCRFYVKRLGVISLGAGVCRSRQTCRAR